MPPVATCRECNANIIPGDRFCASCGLPLARECVQCGGTLDAADRFCPECGTPQTATASEASRAPAGDTLWDSVLRRMRAGIGADYRITRRLGVGGQAAVYLAEESTLRRKVAIKVLAPGSLASSQSVERFKREAQTIATLEHPHIVTIYAVRQFEELHFFVMRHLVGRSLSAILDDTGPLPLDVVRAIAYQVGSALQYAHRRNVVHRDVKPANVLFDEDGNAVVTDFGIAKDLSGDSRTATSVVMGTPAYMSPEQCYQRPVSGLSDQYAFGILIYEMLTGRVPFEGSSLDVMQGQVREPPPPIQPQRADCPRNVEAAVMRMLAKSPDDRWPSMRHALDALGASALPDDSPTRDLIQSLSLAGAAERGTRLTPTDPSRTPGHRVRTPSVRPRNSADLEPAVAPVRDSRESRIIPVADGVSPPPETVAPPAAAISEQEVIEISSAHTLVVEPDERVEEAAAPIPTAAAQDAEDVSIRARTPVEVVQVSVVEAVVASLLVALPSLDAPPPIEALQESMSEMVPERDLESVSKSPLAGRPSIGPSQPELAQPETSQPEPLQPESSQPEPPQPEPPLTEPPPPELPHREPHGAKPPQAEVAPPEPARPAVSQPHVAKPAMAKPEVVQPEVTQPELQPELQPQASAQSEPATTTVAPPRAPRAARRSRRWVLLSSIGVPTVVAALMLARGLTRTPSGEESQSLASSPTSESAPPGGGAPSQVGSGAGGRGTDLATGATPLRADLTKQPPAAAPGDTAHQLRIAGIPALFFVDEVQSLRAVLYRGRVPSTSDAPVRWSSADPATVSVDAATGRIFARAAGETRITATGKSVKAEAIVRVEAPRPTRLVIEGATQVDVGATQQLRATVRDQRDRVISSSDVRWSVAEPSLASVSADGIVRGVSAGSARIEARVAGISAEHVLFVERRTANPVTAPAPTQAIPVAPPRDTAPPVVAPRPNDSPPPIAARPTTVLITEDDVRRWAALVGDLVVSGDVAELRQLYRVEQAGDEQKLDALVNYAQRGKGGLSVRAIRQITSPEDVAAGRTRGLVEFEEATPFGRKRVGVELLLIVSRERGTPRLVAVRIANAPKF